jgi:hypothetical protein
VTVNPPHDRSAFAPSEFKQFIVASMSSELSEHFITVFLSDSDDNISSLCAYDFDATAFTSPPRSAGLIMISTN